MNVIVSGRHFDMNDTVRSYMEERIKDAFTGRDVTANKVTVVVSLNKNRFNTDILANLHGHCDISSQAEGYDMTKTFEDAFDKFIAQIDKIVDKHKR